MKILATISLAQGADMDAVSKALDDEIMESWKLYAAGILREAYATGDPGTIVFILEGPDVPSIRALLERLPLVRQSQFSVDLVELRPFTNWGRLFAKRGA